MAVPGESTIIAKPAHTDRAGFAAAQEIRKWTYI
jgi:hypothetical protein